MKKDEAIDVLIELVKAVDVKNMILNAERWGEELQAKNYEVMTPIYKEAINALCDLDKSATWVEVWEWREKARLKNSDN